MANGCFITFEGIEGSGKSTQVRRLARRLRDAGREVVETREPGGTLAGECVRKILKRGVGAESLAAETELLLFAASRAQLVRKVIRPAVEAGAVVICDRFADSTTVYQGIARALGAEDVARINAFAMGGIRPHLTLLLDLDVEEGFRRLHAAPSRRKAGPDRIERESRQFHEAVRRGYLGLAREEPQRFRILQAVREPTEVAETIWELVRDVLRQQHPTVR